MTDQDPTQRYEPPAAPPPAAPSAPADAGGPAPTGLPADADPVATTPVTSAAASRTGGSRLRWLGVAVLVLIVAGVAAAATALLTGDSGSSDVLAWTPSDAVAYGEARLDLPGDQAAEVAKLMTAFPGFDDQAAFPTKLSEVLDQVTGRASDGAVSWQRDIEPWFGGQVGGSIRSMPTASQPTDAHGVLLLSVKDATLAKAWADGVVTKEGGTTTTESYAGSTITVVAPPAGMSSEMGSLQLGYTVVGPVLAIGDTDSVKAVIDTKGTGGLPTNEQFAVASGSISGDHLGFAYLDYASLFDSILKMAPGGSMTPEIPQAAIDQLPKWIVQTVRAENSALVLDVRTPHMAASGTGSASTIPGLVPSGTLVLIDGHDVSGTIQKFKDTYGDVEPYKGALAQADEALTFLGGFDAVTSWAGEAGIALVPSGDSLTGGVVVVPTDADAAKKLFTQLKGLIQLGGSQAGLSITEEDYNGTTINVVDLSQLGPVLARQAPGVQLPPDLKVSFAVTDQVAIVGYGTDFTKAVLDTAAGGPSLASDARFGDAMSRVGSTNAGLLWVDVAGIRSTVEPMLPADARTAYEADVKPYLDALDYLIQTSEPGDQFDSGRAVLHLSGN